MITGSTWERIVAQVVLPPYLNLPEGILSTSLNVEIILFVVADAGEDMGEFVAVFVSNLIIFISKRTVMAEVTIPRKVKKNSPSL